MQFLSLTLALESIRRFPLRTFLIALSNMVAVFAMIVLVTILQSLEAKVRQLFLSRNVDLVYVMRQPPTLGFRQLREIAKFPLLTLEEAEYLQRYVKNAEVVVPAVERSEGVRYRDHSLQAWIMAYSAGYPMVYDVPLALGRHFNEEDWRHRRAVAVLGDRVARELFPGKSPLNHWIWVGTQAYLVIGVVQPRGSVLGIDMDRLVWLPLSRWLAGRNEIDYIILRSKGLNVEDTLEETRFWLRVHRNLARSQPDNFGLVTTEGFLDILRSATQALSGALVGMVSLGLLVGGIVLMNVLLMAVSERTAEIGLRKALGARPSDITRQFLVEALVLAGLGGFTGVLCSIGVSIVIARYMNLPWTFPWWSAGLGIVLTGLSGIAFGYYPAHRASRLDPITALLSEFG